MRRGELIICSFVFILSMIVFENCVCVLVVWMRWFVSFGCFKGCFLDVWFGLLFSLVLVMDGRFSLMVVVLMA